MMTESPAIRKFRMWIDKPLGARNEAA